MAEHCKFGYQINIFAGKVPKFWEAHKYDEIVGTFLVLKFSFSEKATKICASKSQNHKDDYAHFCGLLRKAGLY